MPGLPVAVALGSNLGDREENLRRALLALQVFLSDVRVSKFRDTEPIGVSAQPTFLNAAVTAVTALDAESLLARLLAVETELGRVRPFSGAPRTVDLDLIFYGEEMVTSPTLTVPHPRFRERLFVLEPLAELAPSWVDPLTGLTVEALLRRLSS